MLSLSPPLVSSNGWYLENRGDPAETLESLIDFSTYHDQTQVELDTARPPTAIISGADEMKKLSIPATVSLVVKYIPELQEQVMGLIQKKEELLSRNNISNHDQEMNKQPIKSVSWSSLSSVSASRLDDREVVIQISTYNTAHKNALSEILVNLEEDGFVLINASSFESFEGRLFYNLHLHQVVERTERLECESLSEKLISLYDKREAQALLP
ncbi:hypothetical protein SLA2020_284130 [Shorea laevis]